jgi:DNA polymerase-3 subunit epsilon
MMRVSFTVGLDRHWSESCTVRLQADAPSGDWVALDFETATASRGSACALGLAYVEGGRVAAVERVLIQPPGNSYDGFNVMIHGIEPRMTADSPTFAEVWPHLLTRVAGKPVVAHNASFDVSVLRRSLEVSGHPYPELEYYCTRILAQRRWPELPSYALELVADHCGIAFGHHDPGEDARASAEIALRIAEDLGVIDLQQVAETAGVRPGHMFAGGHEACGRIRSSADGQHRRRWTADDFTPESDQFDEGHPFYGAEVVFTGTLQSMPRQRAMQQVVNVGGRPGTGVSTRTDFLVVGETDLRRLRCGEKLTSKMKRALVLRESGRAIEIIGEREFLEFI